MMGKRVKSDKYARSVLTDQTIIFIQYDPVKSSAHQTTSPISNYCKVNTKHILGVCVVLLLEWGQIIPRGPC